MGFVVLFFEASNAVSADVILQKKKAACAAFFFF